MRTCLVLLLCTLYFCTPQRRNSRDEQVTMSTVIPWPCYPGAYHSIPLLLQLCAILTMPDDRDLRRQDTPPDTLALMPHLSFSSELREFREFRELRESESDSSITLIWKLENLRCLTPCQTWRVKLERGTRN
jgi:hypothetical protein